MSDRDNDITQVIAALQRRMDALEGENARLRQNATQRLPLRPAARAGKC